MKKASGGRLVASKYSRVFLVNHILALMATRKQGPVSFRKHRPRVPESRWMRTCVVQIVDVQLYKGLCQSLLGPTPRAFFHVAVIIRPQLGQAKMNILH